MSTLKMEATIGLILLGGTFLALACVVVGGIALLIAHGQQPFIADRVPVPTSIQETWQLALSFSPHGLIELGLLLLIATQMLRLALLCGFYTAIHDYKFSFICLFILWVLIYSLFWQ